MNVSINAKKSHFCKFNISQILLQKGFVKSFKKESDSYLHYIMLFSTPWKCDTQKWLRGGSPSRAAGCPQGGLVEPFQVSAAWTQASCSLWILIRGEQAQCVQMSLLLLELERFLPQTPISLRWRTLSTLIAADHARTHTCPCNHSVLANWGSYILNTIKIRLAI